MKLSKSFIRDIWFILVSSIGGLFLVLLGLDIGWIIGTLIVAAFLSFKAPNWLKKPNHHTKGMSVYWLRIGQIILAVELGRKINLTVISTFQEHWGTITIMLLLSVVFSLLSGLFIWKCSQTDMITSFFAAAPGGIITMPGLAQDMGANTGVVSIVQTMRIFLVVILIPMIASTWIAPSEIFSNPTSSVTNPAAEFEWSQIVGTLVLFLAAWGGYLVGKKLKLPSPLLIGGMLGVAVIQSLYYVLFDSELMVWWPATIMIIAQVLMAASIGARFQKSMFLNVGKMLIVALLSTIGFILAMLLCAYFVSRMTDIPFITSVLAFAPGGVAEMAATAIVLQVDSTFVVAVQVLRIVVVLLVLPPLFKLIGRHQHIRREENDSKASVN